MNFFPKRQVFPAALLSLAAAFAVNQQSAAADGKPSWPTTASLNDSRDQLETVFANPREVPTGLYWYWISGNMSPEGIAEDVRSMKRAGINRAYIGFQGLGAHEAPRGNVHFQSPEWYECVRTAMRTATEEGVEIGVFNCPGWSQSGGPWVTPEQSQRYLSTAVTTATGNGKTQTITLPHPENLLTDVKVLATRTLPQTTVKSGVDSIKGENIDNLQAMFDGDYATNGGFTADRATITIIPEKKDFTLRSVTMKTDTPVRAVITVKALQDGKWNEIGTFAADRTNMMIEVGYDILAPTAAALPETKADAYELDIQINSNCRIAELKVSEAPVVNAYADQILSKMFQTPLPFWEQYKWPVQPGYADQQVVDPAEVIDLTDKLNGDLLTWEVPQGDWTITRAFMAPTNVCNSPAIPGEGQGLEIDRWSPDALRNHYDSFIGDLLKKIPAEERATWKYIVSDSYERATQNFGDDFIEYFKAHFGYDPTPYLLTYNGTVVGSSELSERFLWDMRRMLADRLAYDHIGAMRDLANADGLKIWLECYGHWGYPGEFLMYGGQCDEVSGEFWGEGTLGDIENRAASSASHTYGKGKTWAESFTCGGNEFSRSPRTMKQRGDRFFAEGINATLLHLMIQQPDVDSIFPGLNCPFGNEFNRKNTWFSQLDLFTDYLKRANHLLQQGNYVADVAYFIGENAPVMTGITDPALPEGYQYDFINAEVIENTLKASDNHLLTLPHGTSYRLLVLPPLRTMRPELLSAIKKLVEDGAVVLGPKPLRSPSLQNYPQADAEVLAMADELWGKGENPVGGVRKVGKGMVLSNMTIQQAFDLLGVTPDFSHTAGKNADIKYAHLNAPGRDIYFVSNQKENPVEFTAIFRDGKGRQPELWNAAQGTHRLLPSFDTLPNGMAVPMHLDPLESTFIVFESQPAAAAIPASLEANYPPQKALVNLDGPWKVTLTPMVGKAKSVTLPELIDLSTSTDPEVAHFSGTATYVKEFKLKDAPAKGEQLTLNLGNLREMGKVKVNGKYAGGVWTAPYTIDITDMLRKGKNTIEVEVVNTWVNRLVGDSSLPEEERLTHYNYRSITPKTPLQSAGLMGPVEITVAR